MVHDLLVSNSAGQKLAYALLWRRAVMPGVSAIRHSVCLLRVRSSLKNVVRNIESKNILVSLALYLTVHGTSPFSDYAHTICRIHTKRM
jgi:hypothetical protein